MSPKFLPILALSLACMSPRPADAQVALPQVQLPQLPVQLPVDVNRTLDAASPEQLRELRRLRIRDLLRTNRTVLEADPRGAPVVRSEIVALSPSPEALRKAEAAGYTVVRRNEIEGLDITTVVLRAPAGMSTRRALRELQRNDPQGTYDFNHLYMESGAAETTAVDGPQSPALRFPDTRVGLIDGGVDGSHPSLVHARLQQHGCAAPIPSAHGTAVASLLVGSASDFRGAAPGAQLYSADVYCGLGTGGAVDAVVNAFGWLVRERVPVINVSLVGPANRMLEQVVRLVIARGHLIVAAVGNDGPASPALYPAAYPGVVAVTGVDARNRVLLEACRGSHVRFAAPGADLRAATLQQTYASVRGTSFAAPLVAGLLARRLSTPDVKQAGQALALLASHAQDLGAKGTDRIYGKGLVGAELRIDEN
ncbi:MAG TPA: S8 family serine peptidase [Povalibacter sp.]|uniref:S8 family serine peptidase n=1 Tax=Povalibacter sp. TaxID=1962978 RepID=UPI002C25AE03|nr:S8 family serine peptidase [Povalibacter sp.]HMN47338.1 S8 family serine peptidase [Povalibacter sp.]